MTEKVEFSQSSIVLFAELLSHATLPSNHPDLVGAAQRIALAREELLEASKAFAVVLPAEA